MLLVTHGSQVTISTAPVQCQVSAEETTAKDDDHDHNHEETNIQYIGKGDGKSKGKGGFQGNCFVCGEFGHSQWKCCKGKGNGKGFGKDGFKGFEKDGWYGRSKGNDYDKGGPTLQRACIGCGATDHLLKDCPKNANKIQQVQQEEEPEILFIGSVHDDWKHVPMKIGMWRPTARGHGLGIQREGIVAASPGEDHGKAECQVELWVVGGSEGQEQRVDHRRPGNEDAEPRSHFGSSACHACEKNTCAVLPT